MGGKKKKKRKRQRWFCASSLEIEWYSFFRPQMLGVNHGSILGNLFVRQLSQLLRLFHAINWCVADPVLLFSRNIFAVSSFLLRFNNGKRGRKVIPFFKKDNYGFYWSWHWVEHKRGSGLWAMCWWEIFVMKFHLLSKEGKFSLFGE